MSLYMAMHERRITCPHCWELIDVLIDPTESQMYTEDCFVCCRPILIHAKIDGDHIDVDVAQEDLGF